MNDVSLVFYQLTEVLSRRFRDDGHHEIPEVRDTGTQKFRQVKTEHSQQSKFEGDADNTGRKDISEKTCNQ